MITFASIRDFSSGRLTLEEFDSVRLIVRSAKNAGWLLQKPNVCQVKSLSPSIELLSAWLNWDKSRNHSYDEKLVHFVKFYAPRFIKELRSNMDATLMLNKLKREADKNVAIVCFCQNEELCHRSIIAAICKYNDMDIKTVNDAGIYLDRYFNTGRN